MIKVQVSCTMACHGVWNLYTRGHHDKPWYNYYVFTEQPVALGTVFQVKILEYSASWGGSIVSS